MSSRYHAKTMSNLIEEYIIKDNTEDGEHYYIITSENLEHQTLIKKTRYECIIKSEPIYTNPINYSYYILIIDKKEDVSVEITENRFKAYFMNKTDIRNLKIESLYL